MRGVAADGAVERAAACPGGAVRRVLGRFLRQGLDAVPRRRPPGRAVEVTGDWLAELERIIDLNPPRCQRAECSLDDAAAEWLLGARDRTSRRHRDGAGVPASAGLRMQTAHLEPQTQSQPAGRVGKKRLRVEALLATAASPVPPSLDE